MTGIVATPLHRRVRLNSQRVATLAGLCMLAGIGCSTGTTSTATSDPAQPTQPASPAIPPVPTGWVNVDKPYVSYDYPSGWKQIEVTDPANPSIDAYNPAHPENGQVLVQFVPGYPNKSNNGDQCADADQYLTDFYNANFHSTDPSKYPRTQVTWLYLPSNGGRLGGASGVVSVSYQANVASAVNYLIDLDAVPRNGGLYLVAVWSPDYLATPSYARTFISTLVLKYPALPKGSNCSYLN